MKRPLWRITTAEPSRGQPRPTEPSRAEQDITDEDRALLDVNTLDFGSHGGVPWRPTAPVSALQKAVRRALNRP